MRAPPPEPPATPRLATADAGRYGAERYQLTDYREHAAAGDR